MLVTIDLIDYIAPELVHMLVKASLESESEIFGVDWVEVAPMPSHVDVCR